MASWHCYREHSNENKFKGQKLDFLKTSNKKKAKKYTQIVDNNIKTTIDYYLKLSFKTKLLNLPAKVKGYRANFFNFSIAKSI